MPWVQKRSLIPIGTPSKSLLKLFEALRLSDSIASDKDVSSYIKL